MSALTTIMSIVEKANLTVKRKFNTVAVSVLNDRVGYYKTTDKICRVLSL